MSRGELSFSKVRALTRLGDALDEGAEEDLVEFARQATAAELEKLVRGWKLLGRAVEAAGNALHRPAATWAAAGVGGVPPRRSSRRGSGGWTPWGSWPSGPWRREL